MGSSYFGEPSLGNGRSSSSSGSSSRKSKKNNGDKPRQPQRGLGVAQLEKIRLHNQMNCTYLPNSSSLHDPYGSTTTGLNQGEDVMRVQAAYSSGPSTSSFSYSSTSSSLGFQPNIMMNSGEMDTPHDQLSYLDPRFSNTARWNHNNVILENQYATPPSATRQFLSMHIEECGQRSRRQDRSRSMDFSSQHSDSSETQEVDLELKLSL
ncbi:hypothetical protein Scep_007446 [Stephania cephalantha]|uniref:Uncharacterized protein n=1 Tax=Stephania cephalantha TaxID=152367 RepID=A0AAP0PN95_9MAGN